MRLHEVDTGRLREALRTAHYTVGAVTELLGPVADAALRRNETVPGLLALTGDGGPLATLTRLWPLQDTVPASDAERALPGLVVPLCNAAVLERSGGQVRARLDLRPYAADDADLWVLSDLTPGLSGRSPRTAADYVLGVSQASTSLAQLTVRRPVGRALDLGTGCGVQALHLAGHSTAVVATDVNERCLQATRFNAALNGTAIDVRSGSLFEPVPGERFDLVVTNPPFVISPGTGERLVYRDSGLPGDEVVRRVVTAAPGHLAPGGWCQVLANWAHVEGQPWEERISGWLDGSGCDAWVVQREVVDPAQYVEMWLTDAGLHGAPGYVERYDAWLSWFTEQRIEAIGFGWLNLRLQDSPGRQVLRIEEWPYEIEQPIGPEVLAWAERIDLLDRLDDEALLTSRLVRRTDVLQETVGPPGAADPEVIVLRQQRGLRRARQVDTVTAALVGAADGDLAAGQILDAVAQLLERTPAALRREYVAGLRDLVAEGFLVATPA
jgi:hypothetical protein